MQRNFHSNKKFELLFAENGINISPIFDIPNLESLTIRVDNAKIDKKHQILPHLTRIMIELSGEESSKNAHFELLEQVIDICPETLTDFAFYSKCSGFSDKLSKFKTLKQLSLSGDFEEIPAFITDLPLNKLSLQSANLKDISFLERMPSLENVSLSAYFRNQKKKLQEKMPKVNFYF